MKKILNWVLAATLICSASVFTSCNKSITDLSNKIVGCGGCYDSEPYACTQSYHGREIQHNGRNATLGFRIVLRKR